MGEKTKVLLAEDEASLGMIIKESLESRNFQVSLCGDGEEALETYRSYDPDILVLDVMMPLKDGFTLAREIRRKDPDTPIIFLTAKSRTEDVVEGFGHGGNDYLRKPFSMEELIVRVNALLNRQQVRKTNGIVEIGRYKFDYPKQLLILGNKILPLTHREAEVLLRLARQPNRLIERSQILNEIWGEDDFFNGRSMDVFITRLRKKLKQDPSIQIVNVRGFGYKLIC